MKMNSILLDDSIFDFDSWLTEDILNNLNGGIIIEEDII